MAMMFGYGMKRRSGSLKLMGIMHCFLRVSISIDLILSHISVAKHSPNAPSW